MRWNQFIAPTPLNLSMNYYLFLLPLFIKTKNPKIKLPIYLLNPCGYDTCWYYYVPVQLLGNDCCEIVIKHFDTQRRVEIHFVKRKIYWVYKQDGRGSPSKQLEIPYHGLVWLKFSSITLPISKVIFTWVDHHYL